MTRTLYRLTYRSESCIAHDDDRALDAIFKVSVRNNTRERLTGALVLPDGKFVQVLEGYRADVERRMERIFLDPRHRDVTILGTWSIKARLFAGWAMARPDPGPLGEQAFRIATEDGSGAQVNAILMAMSQDPRSLFLGRADFI